MNPMATVLGLDVSLSRTGWAVLTWDDGTLVDCGVIEVPASRKPKDRNDVPVARLWDLRYALRDLLDQQHIRPMADVGIEGGIAYRSGEVTRKLAYATGLAAMEVHDRTGIEARTVPLASAKRLATGRGDADKAEVIAAARARWPECPEDSDMADACWVAEAVRVARGAGMDVEVAG